jgi:hypothetical protein
MVMTGYNFPPLRVWPTLVVHEKFLKNRELL